MWGFTVHLHSISDHLHCLAPTQTRLTVYLRVLHFERSIDSAGVHSPTNTFIENGIAIKSQDTHKNHTVTYYVVPVTFPTCANGLSPTWGRPTGDLMALGPGVRGEGGSGSTLCTRSIGDY